jgi:hypothetical protein
MLLMSKLLLSFFLLLVGPVLITATTFAYGSPLLWWTGLAISITLVLIESFYVSSDWRIYMGLFTRLRKSLDSSTVLDLLDSLENSIQERAQQVIDLVDGVEVPQRNATISALSSSISNEQAEIDAAFARKARALEVAARNTTV